MTITRNQVFYWVYDILQLVYRIHRFSFYYYTEIYKCKLVNSPSHGSLCFYSPCHSFIPPPTCQGSIWITLRSPVPTHKINPITFQIHWALLGGAVEYAVCRRVIPPPQMRILGMTLNCIWCWSSSPGVLWSTPSLPLLPCPLWPGEVVPVRVPSILGLYCSNGTV